MTGGVDMAKGSTERYIAGVRAALADLPDTEVAEIVDDVATYLAELRAELGDDVDLAGRLGSPEAYAAELRSAAGYAPAPPAVAPAGSGGARAALVVLVVATALGALAGLWLYGVGLAVLLLAGVLVLLALPLVVHAGPRVEAVAALPVVRRAVATRPEPDSATGRVAGFVASLQPAWWLLRAFVAAMLVGVVFGAGGSFEWTAVALTLVFAAISVWLGYRARVDRRWLWMVVPLNAFAAVLVLTGWPGWASAAGYVSYDGSSGVATPVASYPGLWQDGERPIEDIRPVDANGVPLTGVYLFDQDGRPIDATAGCNEGYGGPTSVQRTDPYPRDTSEYDERTGGCVRVPPGPLVVAVPTGAAGPSTTGGSTPTDVPPPPTDQTSPTDQAPPTG